MAIIPAETAKSEPVARAATNDGPAFGSAPTELARTAARVRARLDNLLTDEAERWGAQDEDLVAPLRTLRRLALAGGKRLRPAFCEWGFRAAGGDPADESAVDLVDRVGIAFELLHAFALVHDDVMDGSDLRRSEVTAHIEFADRHAAAGWRGTSDHFGESVAILIGDLAHVLASRAMAGQPAAVLLEWRELEVELMMGQYLDVLGTARGDRSAAKAMRIVQLKSGRYTIERPLRIGAELAAAHAGLDGPTPAIATALDGYGRPLGEAFQLRDDVLGVFGDAAVTGKPVGDDLREGKPTLLLALASEVATPAQAELLDRVGDEHLDESDIAAVQHVLVETGARARVEDLVRQRTFQAIDALGTTAVPEDVRAGLVDLAHFIAAREV
jgi:geranylgeranyl diphosphate synthase type I